MPHPHDEVVRTYYRKLDELENVNRQLAAVQPLQEKKTALESDLVGLRDALAGKTPAPKTPAQLQT